MPQWPLNAGSKRIPHFGGWGRVLASYMLRGNHEPALEWVNLFIYIGASAPMVSPLSRGPRVPATNAVRAAGAHRRELRVGRLLCVWNGHPGPTAKWAMCRADARLHKEVGHEIPEFHAPNVAEERFVG